MTPYYEHGGVTIYHGDCREAMASISPGWALVTDPPYGLGARRWQGGPGEWPLKERGIAWDHGQVKEFPAIVARCGQAIVWGGQYYDLPPQRGWLVWDKIVRDFTSGHCELAWTTLDQPIRAFSYSHGALATEGKRHPTQKPEPLMRWCLGFITLGATVFDPFAGSGTTLVAAKALHRRAIGIEIEERYCEIAAKRLSQEVLAL